MRPTQPASLSPGELTRLLQGWRDGDEAARDRVLPIVYENLRRRAAAHLQRDRRGHSLRPTDLVHETYLRRGPQHRRGILTEVNTVTVSADVR